MNRLKNENDENKATIDKNKLLNAVMDKVMKREREQSRYIERKYRHSQSIDVGTDPMSPFVKSPFTAEAHTRLRKTAVTDLDNLFSDSSDEECKKPTTVCAISAKDINTLIGRYDESKEIHHFLDHLSNVKSLVVDSGIKDASGTAVKIDEPLFMEYVRLKFPPEMKHVYDRLHVDEKKDYD